MSRRYSVREIERALERMMADADPDAPPVVALERPDGEVVGPEGGPVAGDGPPITLGPEIYGKWVNWSPPWEGEAHD